MAMGQMSIASDINFRQEVSCSGVIVIVPHSKCHFAILFRHQNQF